MKKFSFLIRHSFTFKTKRKYVFIFEKCPHDKKNLDAFEYKNIKSEKTTSNHK